MENVTKRLGEFIAETGFRDLPSEAVAQAKKCFLDLMGVSLLGSTLEHSRILAEFVRDLGGGADSSIIGYPFKTSPPYAGLVNGAIGHALQMDDGERRSIAHIGTEVIPAALAVAEAEGAGGKDLLTATVLGYEAAIRIGAAVNPSHNDRGFSPNGTIGVFGAAAAAGKILGLNGDQMADAIGSAAMQASGLEEFVHDGSMSKFLNTGHSTMAGVISALLAQRGFTGSHTILEGRKGFCRAYSDEYDFLTIINGIGERYLIMDVYFKPYPTCRYCQPATDVVLELVNKHKIQASDIERALIKTYSVVERTVNNPNPTNVTAATLSMQYSIAVALAEGRSTPDEFTEEKLRDEKIRSLMNRVEMVVADDELYKFAPEGYGAVVEISCKDGRYEGKIRITKGEPENPFTESELIEKYRKLAVRVIGTDKVEEVLKKINKLEEVSDLSGLVGLLHP